MEGAQLESQRRQETKSGHANPKGAKTMYERSRPPDSIPL
jgi:hypothetical protein